jgi:hypothetical protein
MDQGIHNWLLYSGELERSLGEAPHVFRQGDGPVNTLGWSEYSMLGVVYLSFNIVIQAPSLVWQCA